MSIFKLKKTFTFVEENRGLNSPSYFTEVNGYFLQGSLRFDKEEAYALFEKAQLSHKDFEKKTILEKITI